jgi:hypothetical protein
MTDDRTRVCNRCGKRKFVTAFDEKQPEWFIEQNPEKATPCKTCKNPPKALGVGSSGTWNDLRDDYV